MSAETDFQNGFICGMATKGLIRTYGSLDGGDLLCGYPINNGSFGAWPLVLEDGVWAAYPQPSSAIYQVEDFSRLAAYVIGLSVANMDESYSTVVA